MSTVSDDVSLLREALAEITRLNHCLQFEQHRAGRMGTHSPGCHTWGPEHYECAMAALQRRTELLREARAVIVDLGGCADPKCTESNCMHVPSRIDEELEAPPSNGAFTGR